jgi:hypothetical protein
VRAGVRFQRNAEMPGGDTTTVLTVVFDDGRQVRTTCSTEWMGEARNARAPWLETATTDSLHATGILQSDAGDMLAVGTASFPLRADGWWGVRWEGGARIRHPVAAGYRPGELHAVLSAADRRRAGRPACPARALRRAVHLQSHTVLIRIF